MSAASWAAWTPQHGGIVHLSARNRFGLPAGRYRTEKDGTTPYYQLHGVTTAGWASIHPAALRDEERCGALTPLSAAELDRERQEVQLRASAPLRQSRHRPPMAQHDASDLALFRAVNEPRLGL